MMSFPKYNQGFAGLLILLLFMACLVSFVCLPVSAVAPSVDSITPSTGINTTTVSITDITGTGISAPASVKLTQGIFNLSHKGSLVHNAGGAALNQPYSVYVSGNYAYLASSTGNSLEIVDISNPAAPAHAGKILNGAAGTPLLRFANSVVVSGNYSYVTSGAGFLPRGLEIVNVTVKTAPVHEGKIADGTGGAVLDYPKGLFVSGNYTYIASSNSNALEIVNVTVKTAPVHEGSIADGTGGAKLQGASDVYVSGNYAYVASENSNALEIVNIATPSAPVHAGSIVDGAGGAKLNDPVGVHVAGNYAYVVGGFGNSLEIVDVSNPAAPVHKGSIINGTSAHIDFPMNVYVSGNRAYVASGTSKGLEVVDVSDPTNPRHEAFLGNGIGGALLNFPYDVQVAGNYAYVAARDSNALEIVDLADTTWYPKIYGTGVNVASATHISAANLDLTNFPAGLYNVIVSNYNGEQGVLTNGFTITGLPAVTGISPPSGSTLGGTSVTITGTGFTGATAVKFGSTAAASYTVNSATSITATSPAGTAGLVDITVTTAGGTSATSQADRFTYVTPTPSSSSGGSDPGSDNPGQKSNTFVIISPGASAGQSMSFVTGETFTEASPYAIISVTVVPKEKIGQTELLVTKTYQTGESLPGNRHTAGIVSIVPVGVNPSSVDHGIITFEISKSWLEKYSLLPKDIVMMHNTNGIWSELPTTFDHESSGAYFFTATTPGFSYFAITTRTPGTTESAAAATTITSSSDTPIKSMSGNVTSSVVIRTIESSPAVITTSAAPVVSSGLGSTGGFSFFMVLGGLAGIAIIVAGGLFIRRWWIRRQNPALFKKFN
jgi:PGF-pre-PGF domain-containing protein